MFIIRLFTGSIVGMIFGLISLVVLIAVIGAVAIGALAVSGSPGDCTSGSGLVAISQANSDSFQHKWDDFNNALGAGSPASVSLTDSEISSRADTYLKANDAPI